MTQHFSLHDIIGKQGSVAAIPANSLGLHPCMVQHPPPYRVNLISSTMVADMPCTNIPISYIVP